MEILDEKIREMEREITRQRKSMGGCVCVCSSYTEASVNIHIHVPSFAIIILYMYLSLYVIVSAPLPPVCTLASSNTWHCRNRSESWRTDWRRSTTNVSHCTGGQCGVSNVHFLSPPSLPLSCSSPSPSPSPLPLSPSSLPFLSLPLLCISPSFLPSSLPLPFSPPTQPHTGISSIQQFTSHQLSAEDKDRPSQTGESCL